MAGILAPRQTMPTSTDACVESSCPSIRMSKQNGEKCGDEASRSPGFLLERLRLALDEHRPTLTSCTSGCTAITLPVRSNSSSIDGDGSSYSSSPKLGNAATTNPGDYHTSTSLPNLPKQIQAAEALGEALRAFLFAWEGKLAATRADHRGTSILCDGNSSHVAPVGGIAITDTGGNSSSSSSVSVNDDPCHVPREALSVLSRSSLGRTEWMLSYLVKLLQEMNTVWTKEMCLDYLACAFRDLHSTSSTTLSAPAQSISHDAYNKMSDQQEKVIAILRMALDSDEDCYVPAIRCCNAILPSLSDQHAAEITRFCMAGLQQLEAHDLPVLISCLLRSVRFVGGNEDDNEESNGDVATNGSVKRRDRGSKQQTEEGCVGSISETKANIGAIEVIRALRKEWILLEEDSKGDTCQPNSVCDITSADESSQSELNVSLRAIALVLFESLQTHPTTWTGTRRRDGSTSNNTSAFLVQGYKNVLRSLVRTIAAKPVRSTVAMEVDQTGAAAQGMDSTVFTSIDFLAMTALFSQNHERSAIENIIDYMLQLGVFPFDAGSKLPEVLLTENTRSSGRGHPVRPLQFQAPDFDCKNSASSLSIAFLDLSLFLLVGPLRCRALHRSNGKSYIGKDAVKNIEDFNVRVFNNLGSGILCDRFVRSLIQLAAFGPSVEMLHSNRAASLDTNKVRRNSRRMDLQYTQIDGSAGALSEIAYQVSVSALNVFIVILGTKTFQDCQHKLLHRKTFLGHIFSGDFDLFSVRFPLFIDQLCQALMLLYDAQEALQLSREFLSQPVDSDSHDLMSYYRVNHRIGLSLCRRLIQKEIISDKDRNEIWSSVVQIVLWQSSASADGKPSALHPEIGLAALRVIGCACNLSSFDDHQDPNDGFVDDEIASSQVRPAADATCVIKAIVARTGMVQLYTKALRIVQFSKGDYTCLYDQLPCFFASFQDLGAIQSRQMTFCVAPYIDSLFDSGNRDVDLRSPHSAFYLSSSVPDISSTFSWCSSLFDAYLRLGRNEAKGRWCPDGWLTAGLVMYSSSKDTCSASPFVDVGFRGLRQVYACTAAIAICSAVLTNAHEHYSDMVELKSTESAARLLPLIQYQLTLLYELQAAGHRLASTINADVKGQKESNQKSRLNLKQAEVFMPEVTHTHRTSEKRGAIKLSRKRKNGRGGDRLIGNYDTSRRIRFLESLDIEDSDNDDDVEEVERQIPRQQEFYENSEGTGTAAKALTSARDSSVLALQSLMTRQMRNNHFIPSSLIFDCLFSEVDNSALDQYARTMVNRNDDEIQRPDDIDRSTHARTAQIVLMRRVMLQHLHILIEGGSAELSQERLDLMLNTMEQLLPLVKIFREYDCGNANKNPSTLPIMLSAIHDLGGISESGSITSFQLRALLSAYNGVLSAYLLKSIGGYAQATGSTVGTGDESTVESESNSEGATAELKESTHLIEDTRLYDRLKCILGGSDDSFLACEFLDLISLIVVKSRAVAQNLDAQKSSWSVLRTLYTGVGCSDSDVATTVSTAKGFRPCFDHTARTRTTVIKEGRYPLAFDFALKKLEQNGKGSNSDVSIALASLIKYALNSTMKENFAFRHHLLSYWGISLLSDSLPCDGLNFLLESLKKYLDDLSQDFGTSSQPERERSGRRRRKQKKAKKTEKKGGLDRHVTATDCITDIDLPGLTAKSFPVLFEGLLHMIVASFALARPGDGDNGAPICVSGPYKQIQDLSHMFRSVAETFVSRFKLFPRRVLSTVVRACGTIISSSERLILECVAWQHVQPLLANNISKKGARKAHPIDPASTKFLQALVNSIAYNCAGSAILFCDLIQSQAKCREDRSDDDDDDSWSESDRDVDLGTKGENWAYASNQKGLSTLLLKGEQLLDALRSICRENNLSPPPVRMTRTEQAIEGSRDSVCRQSTPLPDSSYRQREYSSSLNSKDSDTRTRAATEASLDHMTKAANSKGNVAVADRRKRKKRRVTPVPVGSLLDKAVLNQQSKTEAEQFSKSLNCNAGKGEKEPDSSSENANASDEKFTPNDDVSFGADGFWGGNTVDSEESYQLAEGEVGLSLNFISAD